MQGRITNIQRFSLNDGSGIRTTIFLHGCNMSCAWCHNPETLGDGKTPLFYSEKCIGCGHCFTVCPTGARAKDFQPDLCIGCGRCAEVCYSKAICMPFQTMSAEEVMCEILQDTLYYRESGGGVTFSGGESLCQADFVSEIADMCADEGIETAIETNLFFDFDRMLPVLRKMSLIMADIKLLHLAEHLKWTGVSNSVILENAIRLGELGIPLIFRTPLIPGVTDRSDNISGIAEFISKIPNVNYYELLNFNPLGAGKYEALRANNVFTDAKPLDTKRLEHYRRLLENIDVPVRIS